MKLSQSSASLIEEAIKKTINKYSNNTQVYVTDIHLQPNANTGELCIYNDEDEELAKVTIKEWTNYTDDSFYTEVENNLIGILEQIKKANILDECSILKPYSFVLVDEEKETVSELLLIDDDTLLINDELLKGLDEELDSFLKDLLEK